MPISRLFSQPDDAQQAVAELRQFKYGKVGIATEQQAGGVLVTADPPFGTAGRVAAILNRGLPGEPVTDSGAQHSTPGHDQHKVAAPLSTALGWPLLSHEAAPLSRLLGLPTLTKRQRSQTKLLGRAAPLSNLTAMPVLTSKAAPFSRLIGMPVLSSDPAPLSRLVGLKVLTTDPQT